MIRGARIAVFVAALAGCRAELSPATADALLRSEERDPARVLISTGEGVACHDPVFDKADSCERRFDRCELERALVSLGWLELQCEPCPDPVGCDGSATRLRIALTERGKKEAIEVHDTQAFFVVARWEFVAIDMIGEEREGKTEIWYSARWVNTPVGMRRAELNGDPPQAPVFQETAFAVYDKATKRWKLPEGRGGGTHGTAGGLIWR